MFGKIKTFNTIEQIETLTQATRGGILATVSSSAQGAAGYGAHRTLVDTKWVTVSASYSGSQLNDFSASTSALYCSNPKTKYYMVYGGISCVVDATTHLSLAIAKNGSVISSSHVVQTVFSGSGEIGGITPRAALHTATRVQLTDGDYLQLQLLGNLTGSNVWSITANLIANQ